MGAYAETLRKHRRIAILRHLEACSEYSSNASILVDVLRGLGITSTRDQVITELTWLKDNGMVELVDHGDFMVATAAVYGIEIAQGVATHPEIQRPRPGGRG